MPRHRDKAAGITGEKVSQPEEGCFRGTDMEIDETEKHGLKNNHLAKSIGRKRLALNERYDIKKDGPQLRASTVLGQVLA